MANVLQLGLLVGAPIPPILEHTTFVEAGALTFGVEYRVLTDEVIESSPGVQLDPDRPRGFDARGVTIHVHGAADDEEYLRFDCFDNDPHYHYLTPGTVNRVIAYDVAGHGDMWTWVISCLRERLPAMLRQAGAESLADDVDPALVSSAIVEIERLAAGARRAAPSLAS
jgi:hypothetical protein